MKLSSLSKSSLLIVVFFGIDKVFAIIRQLIIARQFGMSVELDVFNVANNLPDMLFILISGGAMAMVIIPVLTEINENENRERVWKVFSSIINLAFVVTFVLAVIIAVFAEPIVRSEIGIAPGFSELQQTHVINMMRLNLIATLIFSISGLVMGGLQTHRKFLLPALAPILYNLGQIFGALVLSPETPYRIAGIELPAFGMGIYGLAGGVILGAILHLLIQIPGLIKLDFKWTAGFHFDDPYVKKILRILVPRVITVFFIQLIFIVRDNLASRLETGSVTALSYGYMFQQLPETLIGTALGTAILPSLSLFISEKKVDEFRRTFETACRLSIGLSVGIAVIMGFGLGPIIDWVFEFSQPETTLMLWTLRGFLVGLTGHCLLEVANRAFYAQQDAMIPLVGTFVNLLLYLGIGTLLYKPLNAPGISLTDSIAFTIQAIFMIVMLRSDPEKRTRWFKKFDWLSDKQSVGQVAAIPHLGNVILRSVAGGIVCSLVLYGAIYGNYGINDNLVKSIIGMVSAFLLYIPFILQEIRALRQF